METHQALEGVFALLLTPFHPNREIDWTAYDRYVDWQLDQAPHGLFASCGSSELKHLTASERLQLARRAVERAGTVPVVAVANAEPDVSRHTDDLRRTIDTGVAAVVLIPPDGLGEDQNRLADYVAGLAEANSVPVILYEIPSAKPKDIAPATYARLVRETPVCGIKDTSGTLAGTKAKLEAAPQGIVYQAVAPFLLETLQSGGRGAMVIVSTACCSLVVRLWHEALNGDASAVQSQYRLTCLNALLELGYMATAKYLATLGGASMGLTCRTGRSISPMAARSIEIWHETYRAGDA